MDAYIAVKVNGVVSADLPRRGVRYQGLRDRRRSRKLHMLQAISYAGMISQWTFDDLLQLLDDDRQDEPIEFLEVDTEDINQQATVGMKIRVSPVQPLLHTQNQFDKRKFSRRLPN